MPSISLVVCLFRERDMLERLLLAAEDCFDDLVVVHDGPEFAHITTTSACVESGRSEDYIVPSPPIDSNGIQALVERRGGRYFEGRRRFQQEPHWPFAWEQAKNDWILRLDADEFPSPEMRDWIQAFRRCADRRDTAGFTCIWPLWNGRRTVTERWPAGRLFLFNRQKVIFFGMAEQEPIPEEPVTPVALVLHHQPPRKSYGFRNIFLRKQAYEWRRVIAESLMGRPTDLPCWRWTEGQWPDGWRSVLERPLYHSLRSLMLYPLYQLRSMMKAGQRPDMSACLNPGLHHFLLGIRVFSEKRRGIQRKL